MENVFCVCLWGVCVCGGGVCVGVCGGVGGGVFVCVCVTEADTIFTLMFILSTQSKCTVANWLSYRAKELPNKRVAEAVIKHKSAQLPALCSCLVYA